MIVLLTVIALFTSVFGKINDGKASKMAADYILYGMNKDASSCDNAFKFVCGKWLEKLPDMNESNYYFEEKYLENQTARVMLEALKTIDVNDKTTPLYKVWLRTYYDQCLISNISEKDSAKQIFNGLQRFIGPPPLLTLNKTVHDILIKRNIWNLLGQIQRKLAEGVFFRTSVENVANDCDKLIPTLTFESPSIYAQDQDMNITEMKLSVMAMANILAITIDEKELEDKIAKVVSFNTDLYQFVNQSETETYYEIFESWQMINSTEQLMKVNTKIEWQEFFKGLFSDDFYNWDQNRVRFQLRGKKYFEKIDQLVNKYDVETVFNFVFYKTMKELHERVSPPTDDMSTLDSVESCLTFVQYEYAPAVTKLYFDYTKQNPLEWQSDLNIIVDNIKTSFKQIITKTEWLSPKEMATILNKINHISYAAPIPDWLTSEETVEKFTVKFEPDKGFHDNSMNFAKWRFHLELNRVITGDTADNEIHFYTGIYFFDIEIGSYFGSVLPPLYHFDYPLAMKYGIYGNEIAASLIQRFDWTNLDYTIGTETWLNETNIHRLDDQIVCMDKQVAQIDCHESPDRCEDNHEWTWNYTLNRYLRQIDGLNVAYNAFKMASQNEVEQTPLPDLSDYNADQIFLLSYGRSQCSTYATNSFVEGGLSATQDILNKVFRNFPAYGKSFKCSESAPMNVNKPCSLWN